MIGPIGTLFYRVVARSADFMSLNTGGLSVVVVEMLPGGRDWPRYSCGCWKQAAPAGLLSVMPARTTHQLAGNPCRYANHPDRGDHDCQHLEYVSPLWNPQWILRPS
jgi:hypothetical protein